MVADARFLDQLQVELDEWQRRDLLGARQAGRILAYYGLAPQEVDEARSKGRLALIAGSLGALLVGIGVILFVAANWQELGRPLKVGLLLGLLGAAHGLGYWLKLGGGEHPRIGGALILLGSLLLGANIFLIAQMYHVRAGEPLLLVAWAVGAFGVAYAAGSRGSLYLAILVTVAWYPFQLVAWDVERLGSGVLVALAAFIPFGLLLLSGGELQRSFRVTRSFSGAWAQSGLVVALTPVWLFSFADFWELLGNGGVRSSADPAALRPVWISFAAFAVLALGLTLAAVGRSGRSRSQLLQVGGIIILGASSLLAVSHPFGEAAVYAVVFNLVLLWAILWVIVIGLWTHREAWINLGLGFFVLQVVARYFDLFFTLMDRSLAFVAAGAILLGGGYLLERSRRRLLQTMRLGGNAEVDHAME